MTIPDDFPEFAVYEYLSGSGATPKEPCPVMKIVEATGVDERRLREWLEIQTDYPIASTGRGFWACSCKRDWYPAIRYSVKVFLAYKKRWMRQVWMMKNHHPKHGALFDADRYKEAA